METRDAVLEKEKAQNYPLVAEVMMTKQIVVVIGLYKDFAWCEVRPGTNKFITVRETDLRYLQPEWKEGGTRDERRAEVVR